MLVHAECVHQFGTAVLLVFCFLLTSTVSDTALGQGLRCKKEFNQQERLDSVTDCWSKMGGALVVRKPVLGLLNQCEMTI